jgi:ubiquitin carboxyl-terminal hydrolase 14
VQVKWNKESYDIEVLTGEPLELLKAQLFELTHVPTERQKILVRGKQIKSDDDMKNITEGQKIMMMGTADPISVSAPKEKVVFEEDLTDAQKATMVTVRILSVGSLMLIELGCASLWNPESWKYV